MIREVILNSFASMLSKKDRDGLNSAVRSIIANPKTFLDNKTFNDYQDWLYYNGGSDRALSPQARTKLNYPYNIYALCEDDTLGKYYLEKVMSIVSLHYENWEV